MRLSIRCLSVLLLVGTASARGQTVGRMTFQVSTETTGKGYAPRHVLAVWIADADGKPVRTLAVFANRRAKNLRQWNREMNGRVDGVTGATLRSHAPIKVSWNGRDNDGKLVPDGRYRVMVEFTEQNGSGPCTPAGHIQFLKGPQPVTLRPRDLPAFKKMKLVYTPGGD